MAGQANSTRSIIFALIANSAIAIAKLAGAVITGSSAMLAEAIHSLADCGNQVLLLIGIKRAKRPPSPDYPLGFGKATYVWSFLVAIILFSMGGLFSIYEGVHKLHSSEPLSWPWLAVGILVFAIVAECFSLYGAVVEINKVRDGRTLWRWFRESRQSELVVIFGEDLAALGGLVLALIALLLAIATGNVMFDAAGSIAIGIVLVFVAVGVGIEVKGLLIGQSAEQSVETAMRAWLSARPEIRELYRLITFQLGEYIMVAVKASMSETRDAQVLLAQINTCEKDLKAAFPQIQWLFFEPDTHD